MTGCAPPTRLAPPRRPRPLRPCGRAPFGCAAGPDSARGTSLPLALRPSGPNPSLALPTSGGACGEPTNLVATQPPVATTTLVPAPPRIAPVVSAATATPTVGAGERRPPALPGAGAAGDAGGDLLQGAATPHPAPRARMPMPALPVLPATRSSCRWWPIQVIRRRRPPPAREAQKAPQHRPAPRDRQHRHQHTQPRPRPQARLPAKRQKRRRRRRPPRPRRTQTRRSSSCKPCSTR